MHADPTGRQHIAATEYMGGAEMGRSSYTIDNMQAGVTTRQTLAQPDVGASFLSQDTGYSLVSYDIDHTNRDDTEKEYMGNPGKEFHQISRHSSYMMEASTKKKESENNNYVTAASTAKINFVKPQLLKKNCNDGTIYNSRSRLKQIG